MWQPAPSLRWCKAPSRPCSGWSPVKPAAQPANAVCESVSVQDSNGMMRLDVVYVGGWVVCAFPMVVGSCCSEEGLLPRQLITLSSKVVS